MQKRNYLEVFKPRFSTLNGLLIFAFFAFSAALIAFFFVFQEMSWPTSDGDRRRDVFFSLWDEPRFKKYSNVQPVLAKLLDHILRFFATGLPEAFAPSNFELCLAIAFVVLLVGLFRNWIFFTIFGALIPLSMMTHYFGQFFSEITSSIFLAIGFAIFIKFQKVKWSLIASCFAAIGLANWPVLIGPTAVVSAIAVIGFWTGREKSYEFVVFLCAALVLGVCITILDLWIKGQLFNNPYRSPGESGIVTVMPYSGRPGFSHPLLIGLMGSLFSFGKSIFLFNPFLIFLCLRSYKYKVYMIAFIIVSLIIYSKWWAWYGGLSFGTRFYMFAVLPALFIFIHGLKDPNRRWRILEPIALAHAFWLALCGKHFALYDVMSVCTENRFALEAFCWYVPEFTPLINPFVVHGVIGILERLTWIDFLYGCVVSLAYALLAMRLVVFQREGSTVRVRR